MAKRKYNNQNKTDEKVPKKKVAERRSGDQHPLLQLQQVIGNRVVAKLIQRTDDGEPGDEHIPGSLYVDGTVVSMEGLFTAGGNAMLDDLDVRGTVTAKNFKKGK
jgi:hypothetical protein